MLEHVRPLPARGRAVAAAAGRVLAADAAARGRPAAVSQLRDGRVCRAGRRHAGRRSSSPGSQRRDVLRRALAAGEAMAISTGAVVPPGADAVVPMERVGRRRIGACEQVARRRERAAARRRHRRGRSCRPGGHRLGPAAARGARRGRPGAVRCARRPRVAVLATGSELRAPGEPLGPGEIYESNSIMIAAQLRLSGIEA